MSVRSRTHRRYPVRFAINLVYFSGLIFIGTPVLLAVNYLHAFVLAIEMALVYLVTSLLAIHIVCSEKLSKYFGTPNEAADFLKSTVIAAVTTVGPITVIAFLAAALTGRAGPTKFYYYGIILGGLMFLAGVVAAVQLFQESSQDGIETLKQKLTLELEFLKSFMWAVLAVLLVTAYGQILSEGASASPGEMIIVAYSVFGFLVLVLAPLIAAITNLIARIRDVEEEST